MADPTDSGSRKLPMRMRLTIWVVAIYALIQVITGLGYYTYQHRVAWERFHSDLQSRAEAIADRLEGRLLSIAAAQLNEIARDEIGEIQFGRFAVDIIDSSGDSLVLGGPFSSEANRDLADQFSSGQDLQPLRMTATAAIASELGRRRAEVLALPLGNDRSAWLVIATDDTRVSQQMAVVGRVLVAGAVFGLFASALSGWLISRVAVQPFQTLTDAADQLDPSSIEREILVDSESPEVAKVAAELEAARIRIRSAFESQERFLSNISHELKTPIATLLLEAQTTRRDQMPEHAIEFMDTAEEEMRKLGSLVESFLTLTRVRNRETIEHARRYSANEIVMDAVEDCALMAEQYGVRIDPELASDEAGLDAEIIGDPDLLRTLLNNLIRNAIRFSPRENTVDVIAKVEGDWFTVTVRDRGAGLPNDAIGQVFDRFVQSADEVRRERGHGLGLAIAKGIAEMHMGDISARNHPNGGAEFTTKLPVAKHSP